MMRCAWLLFCLTLAISSLAAADESYEKVQKAKAFAIGGVGVAGIMTPEEGAMRSIRDGANAHEQFAKILKEGTQAGRMYALFGLRQLEAADYDALAQPFRSSKEPVQRLQGCIISMATTSEVVRWIDQYAQQMRGWEKTEPHRPGQ